MVAHHTPVHLLLRAHEAAGKLEPIVAMQIIDEAVSFLQERQVLRFYPGNSPAGLQFAEKMRVHILQYPVAVLQFVRAGQLPELSIE